MNYFTLFIISFTIALSGALAPGPLLATVIYESTKQGFKAGPLVILGHSLLEVGMVTFIVFGFSSFINNPVILKIISIAGALILVLFGIGMILSIPLARVRRSLRRRISLDFKPDYKKSPNLVLTGITMSIANPYWTIWWLTIGLGLLLGAQKAGLIAIVIFFIGHIFADFVWYSVVSFTISAGKKFISPKIYKGIIFGCALILIGFGIYFGLNYSKLT